MGTSLYTQYVPTLVCGVGTDLSEDAECGVAELGLAHCVQCALDDGDHCMHLETGHHVRELEAAQSEEREELALDDYSLQIGGRGRQKMKEKWRKRNEKEREKEWGRGGQQIGGAMKTHCSLERLTSCPTTRLHKALMSCAETLNCFS